MSGTYYEWMRSLLYIRFKMYRMAGEKVWETVGRLIERFCKFTTQNIR
jgi:hypothetical protein